MTATTCFNRALAFRPDDTDLISEVSSLARTQRFRRALMQGAVILTGSLIIAAALGGVFKIVAKVRGTTHKKPVATASTGANVTDGTKALALGQPAGSAQPSPPPRKKRTRVKAVEPPKEVEGSASVTVIVDGPANATVTMDGKPFEPWFGVAHDVAAGEHTFVFSPPDAQCCEPATSKTVTIRPGEPMMVKGTIRWKPATLEFKGSPLSVASCGEVADFTNGPGTVVIKMQAAKKVAHCTVIPPLTSGESPKAVDVPLTAGRSSSFP